METVELESHNPGGLVLDHLPILAI
jgi:hypothetical protein